MIAFGSRVIQVVGVVAAFYLISRKVSWVGVANIVAALFSIVGSIWLWNILTPQLHISFSHLRWERLREITNMSSWMLINQVGSILFLNIDLIVVMKYYGAAAGGRYGALFMIAAYLRSIIGTVVGLLTPLILNKYAKEDLIGMNRLSRQSVRMIGLLSALPVGLLCGLSIQFIHLWLGVAFVQDWVVLVALIIHLPLNLSIISLFSIQVALGKVKWPAIITLAMGLLNIGFALFVAKNGIWGPVAVATIGGIILLSKNALFTPIYSAFIQKISSKTFLFSMLPALGGTIAATAVAYEAGVIFQINSWGKFLLIGFVITLVYSILSYILVLDKEEKSLAINLIRGATRRG